MATPDFDFDDATATDAAGTPQGDGDFETDSLPSTGETSAGGQVNTREAEQGKHATSRTEVPGPHKPTGLELIIDEISTGKILP